MKLIAPVTSLLLTGAFASAQQAPLIDPCPAGPVLEMGAKSKLAGPRVIRKVAPDFTAEARRAGIPSSQVIVSIAVSTEGRACNIRILSPLGFGLDEAAIRAIRQWTFKPGESEGKPVQIAAKVEVNFRWVERPVGDDEKRRGSLNVALDGLESSEPLKRERAVKSLEELSRKKYAPADAMLGYMLLIGQHMKQDIPRAITLLQRADKKDARFAMYALGVAHEKGLGVPADMARALQYYSEAAAAGVEQAQFRMGLAKAAENKPEDAARYFRKCATTGQALCMFHLAKTLDTPEALTWAIRAKEAGYAAAEDLIIKFTKSPKPGGN